MRKLYPLIFILVIVSSCRNLEPDIGSPDLLERGTFKEPWSKPGLVDRNGKKYSLPKAHGVTGKTINVVDYGARPNDPDFDNKDSFKKAIEAAQPGDEVFIPGGNWYFSRGAYFNSYYAAHIKMKSGVNLRGAGQKETVLISEFDAHANRNKKTTFILSLSQSDLMISQMTLTSSTPDSRLPDKDISNRNTFVETAPVYGIAVDNNIPAESHGNVTIDQVTVEKFQRMGIRIKTVHDVRVSRCIIQKATDLGGGGAGYAISIQGISHNVDVTDTNLDTVHNIVEDCEVIGPYMRHGIILQYHAHHNLIRNNTVSGTLLDGIDLHGEDEYGNEIVDNKIMGTRKGAAIGVGNSGATHDASGRFNYIHRNKIIGGDRGIDILFGSPETIIYNNHIADLDKEDATGIFLFDGPGTRIGSNTFENIKGAQARGISTLYAYNALEPDKGIPRDIIIKNNVFTHVTHGIYGEIYGSGVIISGNKFTGDHTTEQVDDSSSFILPRVSDSVIPREGILLLPVHDAFITNENRDLTPSQSNMKFKASSYEIPYNRMIYMKFDLTQAPLKKENIYLRFSGKSKDGRASLNVWGTENYIDWDEEKITWNSAPYHEDQLAVIKDPEGELTLVTSFKFPSVGDLFNTYYLNVTDYVQNLDSKVFTLILSNDNIDEMYCEIYSKEVSSEKYRPGLLYSNE